jgi:NTE family protein
VFGAASLAAKALLADRMVEDLHTMSTINRLVAGHAAQGGSSDGRQVPFLFAGPPPGEAGALADAATEALRECCGDPAAAVRHPEVWALNRLVGGASADHGDLLSFLLFEPRFTVPAAELGARHAQEALAPAAAGREHWPTQLRPAP